MSHLNPLSSTLQHPLYLHPTPPLPDTHSAPCIEAAKQSKESVVPHESIQASPARLPDEIWLKIFKNYGQNFPCLSLVSKAFCGLAQEASAWQRDLFLFSTEADALFDKIILKDLQNTFQAICKAVKEGKVLQIMRHTEAFHTLLQKPFLKKENLSLKQLICSFLLKKMKRGHFFQALQLLSATSIPKLTLRDLVKIDLYTLEKSSAGPSLKLRIAKELGVFMLAHLSALVTQEKEPNMRHFIGLNPNQVQEGVIIKTYGHGSLRELRAVEDLLASRIDVIVGTETVSWAIANRKEDLLTKLRENNFNPSTPKNQGKVP